VFAACTKTVFVRHPSHASLVCSLIYAKQYASKCIGAPTRNPQGARSLFEGLFEALSDQSDLAAPMVQVDEDSKNVFLIWRCPASGFLDATDTFLIDGNTNKIHRQNVFVP